MFFEDRVGLPSLFPIRSHGHVLLATENDLFEEEYVIFTVHLRLGDGEDVVKEEATKVGYVVAFPIFHSSFEILHCRQVLRPSLLLIDLVCDTFGGCDARLELFEVGIFVLVVKRLDQALRGETIRYFISESHKGLHTSSNSGYLQIRCTGLMRNAGSSDFTLRISSRAYDGRLVCETCGWKRARSRQDVPTGDAPLAA